MQYFFTIDKLLCVSGGVITGRCFCSLWRCFRPGMLVFSSTLVNSFDNSGAEDFYCLTDIVE